MHYYSSLKLLQNPARFASLHFLNLCNQFKQNACNIKFIESYFLKYGIAKHGVAKNHIKEVVKQLFLSHQYIYRCCLTSLSFVWTSL